MLGRSCRMTYQKLRRVATVTLQFLSLNLFLKHGHLNLVKDYLLLIFYYSVIVTLISLFQESSEESALSCLL